MRGAEPLSKASVALPTRMTLEKLHLLPGEHGRLEQVAAQAFPLSIEP